MGKRIRLAAIVVPFILTIITLALLAWLIPAETVRAAACDVPSGTHATIQSAVDDAGCDTVNLTDALYIENVVIARNLTIKGQGPLSTTVEFTVDPACAGLCSIFNIQPGSVVTLTNMTIANGRYSEAAGIYDSGILTIINSTVSGNSASRGAGILVGGTLNVISSTVSGNNAFLGGGGAIYVANGTVNITNSTFSLNTAGRGGAIYVASGTLNIASSTFGGNSANLGGAIYVDVGILNIANSTFSLNTADSGGAIYETTGLTTISNSIVANSLSGGDCFGNSYISGGHNIVSDDTCSFSATGDMTNTDPLLGPLQDNGGPTWTHALLVSSPAIDAGNDAACPPADQRGIARPIDGDGDKIARCDIGAYEYDGPPPPRYVYLPLILNP